MILDIIKEKTSKSIISPLLYIYRIIYGIAEYYLDFKEYIKFSSTLNINTKNKLESRIIAHSHVIEKGLSFPDYRIGFGLANIDLLFSYLEKYNKKGYKKSGMYYAAIDDLYSYIEKQKRKGFNTYTIENRLLKLENSKNIATEIKATCRITKNEIENSSEEAFENFTKGRHSIRIFSDKPVEMEKIKKAIEIAKNSPSACNRQANFIYILKDKDLIRDALSLQSGNRGFGQYTDKLLIITYDMQMFSGINERNQGIFDSGLFSMSLLYSLHYMKLGACALNWSSTKKKTKELKKLLKIPESQKVTLMISVGNLEDTFEITRSVRRDTEEIYKIL